jgi:pyruvate-formate lyase-activating enzyme
MLNGERPSECEYCWKIEDLNKDYYSDRHYKTAEWWSYDKLEEVASTPWDANVYPTYLEVSFSNACNFACAYCSPEISSKWMEDVKQNGPYPTKFGTTNLEWLKEVGRYPYNNNEHNPYVEAFNEWFPEAMKHLRVFRMTGGEPTMSKDFWKTMELIKKNPPSDIELGINTNLGVPDHLIDKLIETVNSLEGKVKDIQIYTSAESTFKQAEYARDGINYMRWYSNVERILRETNFRVNIMTTINILSLPSFAEFVEHVMDLRVVFNKNTENNRIPLSVNYLRYPPYMQVTLLDIEDRIQYADDIEKYCHGWLKYHSSSQWARLYLEEWDQIKRFCDYLRTTPTADKYRDDFVKFVNEYDKRRNKNFSTTFPMYTKLLTEWIDDA